MKKILLTAAALVLSASAASAGWTGCRIGVIGGVSAATSELSGSVIGAPLSASIDGLGSDGWAAGGIVGCDYQIDRFVIGGFADYQFQDLKWSAGAVLGGTTIGLDTSLEDQWSVGLRGGITLTPTTLLYGSVGWTQAKSSDITLTVNGTAAGALAVEDAKGWFVGGGIESEFLMPNLFLGIDYRFTRFDSRPLDIAPGFVDAGLDTDVHSVKATLTYKFGPASPAPVSMK